PSLLPSFALFHAHGHHRDLHSFPTRRSSDLPSPRAEAEVRLTDSLFAPGAHLPDTAAVHDWVAGMSRRVWMRTQRAALDELDGWVREPGTGFLRHHTGRFFSVEAEIGRASCRERLQDKVVV